MSSTESRDPTGFAMALLNKLAQTRALDKLGLRKPAERVVFEATKTGFRTAGHLNRAFARKGRKSGTPTRVPSAPRKGTEPSRARAGRVVRRRASPRLRERASST